MTQNCIITIVHVNFILYCTIQYLRIHLCHDMILHQDMIMYYIIQLCILTFHMIQYHIMFLFYFSRYLNDINSYHVLLNNIILYKILLYHILFPLERKCPTSFMVYT